MDYNEEVTCLSQDIPDVMEDQNCYTPTESSESEYWGLTSYYARECHREMRKRTRHVIHIKALARLAIMCVRLCHQSLDNLAGRKGEYESVMQVLDEMGAKLTWGGLTFSPRDFRANKMQGLHKSARRLLRQDPSTRTETDINTLLLTLRNIEAFAEYPKRMQRKLCQVGRFEAYEPRRVLLREGDPPTNFYFILSGAVLVTAFEYSTGTSRTLVSLTKGMSFGELAVISNTKRQATVCTKTDVELLSISGKEFEEIFMAGGRNLMNNAKQSEFIRSVRFLHHWPIQELKGNSQTCSVYYFDRNQVLVRDSNNSDWIYIVLKGSLSVIKKLKRVEAQKDGDGMITKRQKVSFRECKSKRKPLNRHWFNNLKSHPPHYRFTGLNSNASSLDTSSLTNGYSRKGSWESSVHSSVTDTPPVYFRNVMELEHRLEQTLPGYHNSVDRLGCLDYDHIIQDHRTRLMHKSPVLGVRRTKVTNGNGHKDCALTSGHNIQHSTSGSSLQQQHSTSRPSLQQQHINGDATPSNQTHLGYRKKGNNSVSLENPHKSSFLPDIAHNNKIVQATSISNGGVDKDDDNNDDEDDNVSDNGNNDEDNDADDESRLSSLSNATGEDRNRLLLRKRRRISKTSKGVYLAPSNKEDTGSVTHQAKTTNQQADRHSLTSGDLEEDESISQSRDSLDVDKEDSISEKLAKMQLQYQRRVTEGEGRKTIAEELDYKARREFKFTEADLDPTIIELQVLERGQYFGVSPMLFPDQPSLSVISNGAECVVISKKFFLRLASEKCLRHLRQTESPYPSDEQLRLKLQDVVNWQSQRSSMYRSLESKILEKQTKRKQFLPMYQGQYCFRTGPI